MPSPKPIKRFAEPVAFPEMTWQKQVVEVLYKRKGKRGHISRFLSDPRQRERLKGKQALPTKVVKAFADQFPGRDMDTVMKLFNAVRHFKMVRVPASDLKYFYARRTAEDIIHTKTAIALNAKEVAASQLPLYGCIDHALALIAALRAKGIKAEFVREGLHSWVWLELDGKKYRADPSYTRRHVEKAVYEITPEMEKGYRWMMGTKPPEMAVGRDAWDLGIFSLDDCTKYYHPKPDEHYLTR